MSEELKTPDSDAPLNPPSIMSLDSAELAQNQGRTIRLSEPGADPTMVRIPARLRKLKEIGENTELLGIGYVYKGSILVSIDGCSVVEKDLIGAIEECDEPEAKAALANAYASVLRSKAMAIKATGEIISSQGKDRKARKTFAKGEKIGPLLEAKSA